MILRVFPHRTSYTPTDSMVRIGCQTLGLPKHDEVHISCTFTWDMDYCEYLKEQYEGVTDKPVLLGGCAYNSPCGEHTPGMYTREGIIFTSRGCNNNCSFCFVPKREGKLREIEIKPGNIIQDNNFLQCSQDHQQKVFDMLHKQRAIELKGGLETRLINPWFAKQLAGLQQEHRLKSIWLACDSDAAIKPLAQAIETLQNNSFIVNNSNTFSFVLSYGKDLEKDEQRAKEVWKLNVLPFVQLYQDGGREKISYPSEVTRWARTWQRPAIIRSRMREMGL